MISVDIPKLEHLTQTICPGSRLLRTWPLKGGISAQMTALEIKQPDGRTKRLIVRQPGASSLLLNPSAAADEFKLLQILTAAGLPVPTPHYLDERGEILSTPSLILEYIEGEPMIAPSNLHDVVLQLAAQLAQVHSLPGSRVDLSFLPRQQDTLAQEFTARPSQFYVSLDEERIRKTLENVWPLPQTSEPVLLHGDFWPGNILWREERIAAVIDWEEAEIGDRLCDVSRSRLDILWAYGSDAMDEFTAHYRVMTAMDGVNLPYWDLFAALRPIPNIAVWAEAWSALGRTDITEATMRDGHRRFIAQAFEKIGVQ